MWMRTLPFARKFRFMDADGFFRFVGDRTYREVLGDKLVCWVLDRGHLVSGRFFAGRTSCYARSLGSGFAERLF